MWLVDLLLNRRRWTTSNVPLPDRMTVEYDPATLSVVDDPANLRTFVKLIGNLAGQTISNPTLIGQVTFGPVAIKVGAVTTTGVTPATLITMPLATNHLGSVSLMIVGRCAAGPNVATMMRLGQAVDIPSGVINAGAAASNYNAGNIGLPCSLSAPTWSAGVLSFPIVGPQGVVSGSADNGAGKLRLTVTGVTSGIDLVSVTAAGLGGTPLGNGAHVAHYVDASHIDFTDVTYVANDASGTIVFTTPPVFTWQCFGLIVATP